MKLSRFSKKVIAIVCSLAMVVATSVAFKPVASNASQEDAKNYDWSTVAWMGDANTGHTNQFKFVKVDGNISFVNIQSSFGTKPGLYATFGDASFGDFVLNGDTLTQNTDYAIQGAGVLLYCDSFTAKYSELVIKDALGNVKATVYAYNDKGEDETTTVDPSAPTTTAAPTTTPEPTTKSPTVLPDWDTLEWTEVSGMYTDIAYCVVDHTIAGWGRMNFYGVNYMQFVGSGDSKFNEATMEVLDSSANDVSSRLSWNDKAAAIWGKMVSQLGTTDEYYLFTVDNPNTGYVQVAVRVGHPGGEPTSYVPQKPLAPSGLVWAGNDNLPYYFAWGASATPQIDHYNFYVGETKIGESNGTAYDAASYFADAAPGPYTLKVTAVKDDLESDPATLNWTRPYPAGYYNVADYKSTTPYTYPTKEGKIFAGWFTDDTCTTAYTETTGYAYAKFIDEKVLGTKFQVANDGSAIRFLSSLDSMDYQSVGFKFTGHYGNAVITEKTKSVEKLYTKINADGTEVLPTVFSDDSTYFFTYTVRGMTNAGTNSDWNVTPFYVTLDGTTVEGTSGVYPQN